MITLDTGRGQEPIESRQAPYEIRGLEGEFDKGRKSLTVAVNGPLIVDDADLLIRAAIDGVGLAFLDEERVAPHLASGALVRVLEDPSRRQLAAALSALTGALRLR